MKVDLLDNAGMVWLLKLLCISNHHHLNGLLLLLNHWLLIELKNLLLLIKFILLSAVRHRLVDLVLYKVFAVVQYSIFLHLHLTILVLESNTHFWKLLYFATIQLIVGDCHVYILILLLLNHLQLLFLGVIDLVIVILFTHVSYLYDHLLEQVDQVEVVPVGKSFQNGQDYLLEHLGFVKAAVCFVCVHSCFRSYLLHALQLLNLVQVLLTDL